jgi:hypothetical protein
MPTTHFLTSTNLRSAFRTVVLSLSVALLSTLTAISAPQTPAPGLLVTPSAATLLVGEPAAFSAIDDSGRPLTDVHWSLDPPLAELHVENGEITLGPKQPGHYVLTATAANQSATATIAIVADAKLPAGTVRWSLQPLPGYETLFVRQSVPGPSEVAFYSVEWSKSANAVVRALQISGQQLWATQLSSSVSPLTLHSVIPAVGEMTLNQQRIDNLHDLFPNDPRFPAGSPPGVSSLFFPIDGKSILVHDSGDNFGGLLLLERGRFRDSLVDLNPADGSESWRYRSEGRLNTNWTVNYHGDIGVVELLGVSPYGSLIVIDGHSGAVRFRIPFPDSSTTINGFRCKDPVYNVLKSTNQATFGSVFTSQDGNMYIQIGKHVELSDNHNCKPTQFLLDDTLSLLRVTPEGAFSWRVFQHVHADGDGGFHVQPRAFAGESIPDGFGGVLAAWTWVDPHKQPSDPLNVHIEARLTRLSDSGQRDFTLPMPFWTKGISSFFAENMVLAEGNQLYAINGPQLIRFDTQSGNVDWLRHPPTGEVKLQHSVAGGGVLVANAGRLVYFDEQGNGVPFPWTVAVPNPEDIGLVQTDLFDHSPAAPLALREAEGCWVVGNFIAVEDGAPHGRASLVYFAVQ